MDFFTHGLFSFLSGKRLGRSRPECAALLLGGFAPDFDVFISWMPLIFNTPIPLAHRGITHSLVFGFATAAIALFIFSRKRSIALIRRIIKTDIALSMKPSLFAMACIGVVFHLFLDWLTAYGILLFYPFSMERYSAELFFYIDFYIFAISASLIAYAVFRRHKIRMPPELRSTKMQSAYIRIFSVLIAALFALSGLRYYEKSATAEYFNVPKGNIFPSSSIFTWQAVDNNEGKIYAFDSFRKRIISESSFSGGLPEARGGGFCLTLKKHSIAYFFSASSLYALKGHSVLQIIQPLQ